MRKGLQMTFNNNNGAGIDPRTLAGFSAVKVSPSTTMHRSMRSKDGSLARAGEYRRAAWRNADGSLAVAVFLVNPDGSIDAKGSVIWTFAASDLKTGPVPVASSVSWLDMNKGRDRAVVVVSPDGTEAGIVVRYDATAKHPDGRSFCYRVEFLDFPAEEAAPVATPAAGKGVKK